MDKGISERLDENTNEKNIRVVVFRWMLACDCFKSSKFDFRVDLIYLLF
jgi:hypothetical protein